MKYKSIWEYKKADWKKVFPNTTRMNQFDFFFLSGSLVFALGMLYFIFYKILGQFIDINSTNFDIPRYLGIFLFFFLMLLIHFLLFIRRLRDINFPDHYVFILFIPIINIIFGLYVIFKMGVAGPNEFGEGRLPTLAEIYISFLMYLLCFLSAAFLFIFVHFSNEKNSSFKLTNEKRIVAERYEQLEINQFICQIDS